MKWFIYYAVSLTVNIAAILLFKNDINIDAGTAAPVFLLFLSVFMAAYYYTNRQKEDFSTNYYSNVGFTDDEWATAALYTCRFNVTVIPFYIPFVFFFSPLIKTLASVVIFIIAMVGGVVFYRIKHRKELRCRFDMQKRELEEQKKLEESGKWKK